MKVEREQGHCPGRVPAGYDGQALVGGYEVRWVVYFDEESTITLLVKSGTGGT